MSGVGELHHFTANNVHLDKYEPIQKRTYGSFHNAASLDSGIMQKMVASANYRWNTEIINDENLQNSGKSSKGYFVEIDLNYSQKLLNYSQNLQNLHSGLPLIDYELIIESSWFSAFAKQFAIKRKKNA